MLIADGGGYGGTDWMSKDVRFMWSTIANQDTDPHFDVVEGWRKTADLTLAHLAQVQMYRDNLASVWPPTKSAAAAAYLERLDRLLVDLQATHDAASANYTAFSTVALTLSLARNKLKPILDQYEANEQLNVDWQAKQDEKAKSKTPVLTPILAIPPVSASRQEQLNNQARVIMYDLSNTVISGNSALQKPQPYMPGEDPSGEDGKNRTNDNNGFAVPPVVPPPGGGSSISASTNNTVTNLPAPPAHSTTTTPTSINPSNIGGIGTGPILGGIGSTPAINPPTPSLPGTGPAPSPLPGALGVIPGIVGSPGAKGLTPPGGLLPNGTRLPQSGGLKPGVVGGSAGRIPMPSGGVIGATPGSGVIGQIPSGGPGARAGNPARANPVGGVIGQQGPTPSRGTASGRSGGASHGAPGPSNLIGPSRGRRSGDADGKQSYWDPDNPWATEEGVDPVLLPPPDPGPIDPGPAIGYSR